MTWTPLDEPVDAIVLSGQRSPGICELQGWTSPRRWDERRGYGLSGATVVFKGIGLARGKIIVRLYTAQHWADWEGWRPLVQRPPLGERPRALEAVHPILEGLGVRSIVVEDVSQPTQTGDGEWTIEITAIEFRRPEIALARPDGAQDAPTDPADQAIANIRRLIEAGANGNIASIQDMTNAVAPLGGL